MNANQKDELVIFSVYSGNQTAPSTDEKQYDISIRGLFVSKGEGAWSIPAILFISAI